MAAAESAGTGGDDGRTPDEAKVEIVARGADGSWRSIFLTERAGGLPLPCLELVLPMAAIYADIAFDQVAGQAG